MADDDPTGGLDPATLAAIQGGFPPLPANLSAPQMQAPPPDAGATFGDLHPAVAAAVQSGFAPTTDDSPPNLSLPTVSPPPANAGANLAAPTPSDATHAYLANAIANGFQPPQLPPDIYGTGKPGTLPSPEATARQADSLAYGSVNAFDAADRAGFETQSQLNDATARIDANYAAKQRQADALAAQNENQYQADQQQLLVHRAAQVDQFSRMQPPSRKISTGGLIAVALSGIGDALDHRNGPNAALQILQKGIDDQMADYDRKKADAAKGIDLTDSQINAVRGVARDDREARQLYEATLLKEQANDLTSAANQYANPMLRAKAMAAAAERNNQRAQILGSIATRQAQAQKDQREQQQQAFANSIALRGANRADEEFAFRKTQYADALAAAKAQAALAGNQALAAKADQVQQEGVFDPRTADPLLNPQGRAQATQADQLEAAARLARDPQQAQQLQQQAQQLRQASTLNAYTIKDKDDRSTVRDTISQNQNLVDIVSDIQNELAKGPSGFDRSAWAGLGTRFEEAKAAWILGHKSKASSREFDAITPMFGADPSSFFSREGEVGKMQSSLGAIRQQAVADGTRALRTAGIHDTWQPRETQATPAPALSGLTAVEAAQGQTPGVVGGLFHFDPGAGPTNTEESDKSATGLTPADERTVRGVTARFAQATAAEDQLRDQVANLATLTPSARAQVLARAQAVQGQREAAINQLATYASSPRSSLASSVWGIVREDPALAREVGARLSPEQQKQLDTSFTGFSVPTANPTKAQIKQALDSMPPAQRAYLQQVVSQYGK